LWRFLKFPNFKPIFIGFLKIEMLCLLWSAAIFYNDIAEASINWASRQIVHIAITRPNKFSRTYLTIVQSIMRPYKLTFKDKTIKKLPLSSRKKTNGFRNIPALFSVEPIY
jgi:hypothetical protein